MWLDIRNLNAVVNGKTVLKEINLSLHRNDIAAIIGPNGSGKTTLINIISRNLYPIVNKDSYIKIFNKEQINIWNMRSKIGFVTGDIYDRTNQNEIVLNFIISGLYGYIGLKNMIRANNEQIIKTKKILNTLNLNNISNKRFIELSEGQKRRVIIARALINNPEILVMDEPSSMLDIKSSINLINNLRLLSKKGIGMLYVTNSLDTIIPETNKLIMIKDGQILNQGNISTTLTNSNLSKLYEIDLEVIKHGGFWRAYPSSRN